MKNFKLKIDLEYDPKTGEVIDKATNVVVCSEDYLGITVKQINDYINRKSSKAVEDYKRSVRQDKIKTNPALKEKDPESIVEAYYGKDKSWAPIDHRLFKRVINWAIRYKAYKKEDSNKPYVDLNFIDTKHIVNMTGLFSGTRFCDLDISKWDVSNVKYMDYMFCDSSFNGDISNWDVSNVKTMNHMFAVSKFNQDISKWNVSNVTDMSSMFMESDFNQDISKWNVSNVHSMDRMFFHSRFNQNISKWDVSNVRGMRFMFSQNESFNQDLSKWEINKDANLRGMFSGSSLENKLPRWYKEKEPVNESIVYSKVANKILEKKQFSKELKKLLNE